MSFSLLATAIGYALRSPEKMKFLGITVASSLLWVFSTFAESPAFQILVEDISSFKQEDILADYGMSPVGLEQFVSSKERMKSPVQGEKSAGSIRVFVGGSVRKPATYYFPKPVSILEATDEAGGFTRLGSGRFLLQRENTVYRIYAGSSHSMWDGAKEFLSLIALRDGDILWASEVLPY